MSDLKLPNRDEYTLDQALDYLEKFHNEKRIDKSYLLYHAKKGNLKTVIKLEVFRDFSEEYRNQCRAKISLLNNKKQIDNIYYLKNGSTKIIFNDFETKKENSLIGDSTRYVINRDHFFIDFNRDNIRPPLVPRYPYEEIQWSENEKDVFDDITDFYFSAFFQIESYCYSGDERIILEQGFILKEVEFGQEFISISTKNNEYISFVVEPPNQSGIFRYGYPPFKIDIEDILVLHKDLMQFVGIEIQEENKGELNKQLEKLKNELSKKDKEIETLRCKSGKDLYPILLGKYRDDDLLKIAIEVRNKYWMNWPENAKSNVQIIDYIIRDYGVAKTTAKEIEKIACPINRKKN
ncbi:hypothetical protein K7G91_000311 [Pasteurella canis]|uniref:hypothetical protein n=1 Tax=Pasteurella canis TaxID=753 RepID=UPI001D102E36|nr:hypothetical protein [Pasteurella canis]UDW84075.1 hypothetical protein K7G91_000311 [Pasteurella canis]